MKVTACAIADVLLIEPRVFGDERGFFMESFNQRAFNAATGLALADAGLQRQDHARLRAVFRAAGTTP